MIPKSTTGIRNGVRALRYWLHRYFVFPTAVSLRGEYSFFPALRTFERLQWSEPDLLRQWQERKLGRILEYAVENVPYYRERWDGGHLAGENDAFEMLSDLPFLTKNELQKYGADLTSRSKPLLSVRKTTGGSTGEPVTVLKDSGAVGKERAASWLCYRWYGIEIGDRGARFWGSPTGTGLRRLSYDLADLAKNRLRFSAFAFTDENLEEYWQACLRSQPTYFYGYVSMLSEFARFLRARDYSTDRLDLTAIVTTSEALTVPQRELLESTFDVPVRNEYGCGELGPIAYECEEGSLHVMSENVVVEVLDQDGRRVAPGEDGEIVVTDLQNRAMPLIRYRIGDHATVGHRCRCGRGFPTLAKVWGREYDFVRGLGGERYHGEYFMYLFEDLRDRGAEFDRFRVTQSSRDTLELEIVAEELPDRHRRFLDRRLRSDLGDMTVEVCCVEALPRSSSGKTRIIRNHVESD